MSQPYCNVGKVIQAVIQRRCRKATKYVSEKYVVKATRRTTFNKHARTQEFVVTIGRPNYLEQKFIKLAKKGGEPFPIKKIQLVGGL